MNKSNEQQEKEITELMAKTYRFYLTYRKDGKLQKATCCACGKRFMGYYIGMPINERMIRHYETFHNPIE